jgi:diguanylate cyclase (GGDEF)-like protein
MTPEAPAAASGRQRLSSEDAARAMPELKNLLLLVGDALIYFIALAALFRSRQRLGIGAFFCALGVMHFIETYLASIFYLSLPLGLVASPGSTALFTGKLLLLLLVYIREDAAVVRQPIYGLLFGNLLMVALALVMRFHDVVPLAPGRLADFGFLDSMGLLMMWGTALLFIDSILIILLYERSRAWFGQRILPRLLVSAAAVLTFDQIGFFAGLHVLIGADISVMIGGWAAKMGAAVLYSALVAGYLYGVERQTAEHGHPPRIADVFEILTYRERYHDLLARSGRDALTGALDRGALECQGRAAVGQAALAGRPVSVMVVDLDHFKALNDRYGHATGDAVLRRIATAILETVSADDPVFRFGGDEFVVICDNLAAGPAVAMAERLRRAIAGYDDGGAPRVTVSIGLATCAEDASDYDALFATADRRLYEAKAAGRNCVVGGRGLAGDPSVRLAYAG